MQHSAQIVTLSAQRLAYGSTPLEPDETRPKSNFPESRVAFSNVRSAKLNTDQTILMPSTDDFGETALKQCKASQTCYPGPRGFLLILSFFIWKFATRSTDRSAESGEKENLWSRPLRISLSWWLST